MKPNIASTLLESQKAQPRGKRLAPIKATDLKNKDLAMSPRAELIALKQNQDLNAFGDLAYGDKPKEVGGPDAKMKFFPQSSQSTLPKYLLEKKTGIGPLPVIDHQKQKKKLQTIIGMCQESENSPKQFRQTDPISQSKYNIIRNESTGLMKGAMSRESLNFSKAETKNENVEQLKQQRRRLASHQNLKEPRNVPEGENQQPKSTIARVGSKRIITSQSREGIRISKKITVNQVNLYKDIIPDLEEQEENADQKEVGAKRNAKYQTNKVPSGRSNTTDKTKPPVQRPKNEKHKSENQTSKWFDRLLMQMFRSFAERLEKQEIGKKVTALKKMRLEMQRRFLLLYKHFRNKKYGEPLPLKKKEIIQDQVDDLFEEDREFIKKIKALLNKDAFAEVKKFEREQEQDKISDLHSIKEEESDDIQQT